MPKTPPLPALPLPPRPAGTGVSDWLHRELRAAILEGRLVAEARLPSSRSLASQLAISRGTVTAVYGQLAEDGFVEARTGDGTRVLSSWQRPPNCPSAPPNPKSPVTPVRLSDRAAAWQRTPFPMPNDGPARFQSNEPSVLDFPLAPWTRLVSRRLHRVTRGLLREREPMGYLPLREAIATHLRETRGLHCSGAQVLIVSGTQMAMELTARLLLNPGDAVWVEDPGYPGASRILTAMGARLVPVPVDAQGLRVETGKRRAAAARMAVVTPAHQFPLGVTLSLARRAALLEWAQGGEAWVFEDDYDSEFRFAGRPLMALQGMPGGDRVLFCGSFGKMLYPGIRLGFLVLPEPLVEPFRRTRSLLDRFPAGMEQAVLADFITEGHFERHLRRMRVKYLERQEVMVAESRRVWGDRLTVPGTDTGLQSMAWLAPDCCAKTLADTVAPQGYDLIPLTEYTHKARFCLGHPVTSGLQIGFGSMTPEELRKSIRDFRRFL